MTLLFTAALIFLPDIGLWSLYKEKHLVKPPEAAEPQVGARRPGAQPRAGRRAAAAPRARPRLCPCAAAGPGAGRGAERERQHVCLSYQRRREKVVRAAESARLGFPGKGKG